MKAHWVAYDNLTPGNAYTKDIVMVNYKYFFLINYVGWGARC